MISCPESCARRICPPTSADDDVRRSRSAGCADCLFAAVSRCGDRAGCAGDRSGRLLVGSRHLRRIPRIRTAPGRDPHRGARPVARPGRSAGHAAAGKRADRCAGPGLASIELDSGLVDHYRQFRSGQRRAARPAGRFGAACVQRRPAAPPGAGFFADPPHFVDQHGAGGGLDLVPCLADGPAHQRRMADQCARCRSR